LGLDIQILAQIARDGVGEVRGDSRLNGVERFDGRSV
jgi:hypothetical protein